MLPTHRHLVCHAWFHWSRASGASPTTPIAGFVVASARGSFKPCAVGVDGAVPGDRVLSRMPLAALHVARPTCAVAAAPCRVARGAWRNSRLTPAVCVKPVFSVTGGRRRTPSRESSCRRATARCHGSFGAGEDGAPISVHGDVRESVRAWPPQVASARLECPH